MVHLNFASLFNFMQEMYFLAQTSYTLNQKKTHQSEFFGLLSDWVKIHKIYIPYLKLRVTFSLNFASLFIVMRDNSFVIFQLKIYIILTKGVHQSAKF